VRRSHSSVEQPSPLPRPASSLKRVSRFTLSVTNRGSSTTRNIKRTLAQIDPSRSVLTQVIRVGCELVENESWPTAPTNIPIIGLKELPVSDAPLSHTHVQFAHCYKQQAGWSSVLARFHRGGGTLYDLEFLNDVNGRRIAAFGFHAGFAGAAAGALAYAAQKNGEKLGRLEPYLNEQAMVADVKAKLGGREANVKALVIGALGRCGRGAVDFFRKIGLEECVHVIRPDMA
jgi:saccharopine dehydrogenase (NAD+, L-lysine-forming)